MSPEQLSELQSLHPVQQAAYYEIIMWGSAGTERGFTPTTAAIDKALEWAKQVPIPEPVIETKSEETE